MADGDDGDVRGVLLSVAAIMSFWVQAVVTEERLVPALNVVADWHRIPDDVAGATLMAAGASSPELLCTLVSLFVTRSSLGLGTIVGSEVFNLFVVSAGSVYASKGKRIVLDRRAVAREAAFYGLSIALLSAALLGESRLVGIDGGKDDDVVERVCVNFWRAALLFGGYVLYVVTCANTDLVERRARDLIAGIRLACTGGEGSEGCREIGGDVGGVDGDAGAQSLNLDNAESLGSVHYKSFDDNDLHQLPFIYNVTTEPVENWDMVGRHPSLSVPSDDVDIANSSLDDDNRDSTANKPSEKSKKKTRSVLSAAMHKSFKLIKANHILCRDDYPVEINDVYELTSNEGAHEIGCFLWQRSYFYAKARFGSQAFHLRWFAITPSRITSVPDRQEPDKHAIVYPLFNEIHVDQRRLIILIMHPLEGRQDFTLMAPNRAIFDAVVQGLDEYMNTTRPLRLQGKAELDDCTTADEVAVGTASAKEKREADSDDHVDLIEVPRDAPRAKLALWAISFPLRLIMHHTLPDVRRLDRHGQPRASASYAYLAAASCLIWLIAGSLAMVSSLESLARLLGIPDAIMGVTVSAAGTSFPAYVASRVAAEKGFGNQAIANVFGSNTFNICMGLGFPWTLYIIVMGFEPYNDLEKEGILESILVMSGTLLIFIALMVMTNFVLVKWHANLFIGLYLVYIVYSIGQVYW